MTQKKSIRVKFLTVRLSEDEYALLEKYRKATTCRQLSEYVRALVLNRPANIKYRNTSLDDFLTDMTSLKRELNAVGNNFNEVVHKLHQLEHIAEFQSWLLHNEKDKAAVFAKIDLIQSRIQKMYEQWSEK